MAAVAAANESGLQSAAALQPPLTTSAAAADDRPLATIDPRLLMAARRGDGKALKDLLQLNDVDDQQGQGTRTDDKAGRGIPTTGTVASASTSVAAAASMISLAHVFTVEMDPRWPHDDVVSAAQLPPAAVPVLHENGVTIQGDSLLHVVAACGDGGHFVDCANTIVHDKKRKGGVAAVCLALEARNNKGDTPLHCAAGAGNTNMISCLIGLIANTADLYEARAAVKKAFLKMQNGVGETVLHHATIRAANNKVACIDQQVACIDQLVAMDPELACIPHHDEDAGASPLYLAISLGEVKIAEHLYSKSGGKLSYSEPDGCNVLHAAVHHDQGAVHRDQVLPKILKWLEDMKRKEGSSSVPLLVSQLTSQRDKKHKGRTPLHLAASLRGWQTARLLLDANESTAYQADDEGSYPIHVAAWSNSLGVVNKLLQRCQDYAALRDGKGRTFLHVVTEKGRRFTVTMSLMRRVQQVLHLVYLHPCLFFR